MMREHPGYMDKINEQIVTNIVRCIMENRKQILIEEEVEGPDVDAWQLYEDDSKTIKEQRLVKKRITMNLPDQYCKNCCYYMADTMMCQKHGCAFPPAGFCSKGSPKNIDGKDSEQDAAEH